MATKTEDALPNQTVYINNINDKIKEDDLRRALYALFSQFGPILDIHASRNWKMRGQAFIVFKDIASAAAAVRQMGNFNFFEKPIKVSYARAKSDVVARLDGSYVPRQKRKEDKKRKAEDNKNQGPNKRQETEAARAQQPHQVMMPTQMELPNKILFLQNVPEETTKEQVVAIFQPFTGFKDVAMVPGRKGIAFVEFDDEIQSGVAMGSLQGFRLDNDHALVITFAKS
eukprot:TRINITY_DN6308_c0_g1_i1.p1 TRINITY_DN6308_c0_g1~~TRINITY_DN6308_c0_g1_i1.p1  ORF type:complete len:228 (+),score=51.55 TRINITY_DN6308_c0_g1_i1:58-741(+)